MSTDLKGELLKELDVLLFEKDPNQAHFQAFETFIQRYKRFLNAEPLFAASVCERVLPYCKENELGIMEIQFQIIKAFSVLELGSFLDAVEEYKVVIQLARDYKSQFFEIVGNNNLGTIYLRRRAWKEGIPYLFEAHKIFENNEGIKVDARLIFLMNSNLGSAYLNLKIYDKARIYFEKAIEFALENEMTQGANYIKNYVGQIYLEENKFDLAEKELLVSMESLSNSEAHYWVYWNYNNVINLYFKTKRFKKGFEVMGKAVDLILENKLGSNQIEFLPELKARILEGRDHFSFLFDSPLEEKMLQIFGVLEAFGEKKGNHRFLPKIYETIALFFEQKKNFEKALSYSKKLNAHVELKIKNEIDQGFEEKEAVLLINQKQAEIDLQKLLLETERETNNQLTEVNNSINQRKLELQEMVREIENFAFITHHDLKEPLRSMTGFLQLLRRKMKPEETENIKFAEFAISASNRVKNQIESLLFYTHLTNKEIHPERISLKEMVPIAYDKVKEKEEGAVFRVEGIDEIQGDREMIQLVFYQLLSNSMKYKSKDKPEILIQVNEVEGQFLIDYFDNGKGIEKRYREKVFDIFRRLNNVNDYKGMGVGLSICKKIMKKHKGKISILDSNHKKGTHFRLSIPQKQIEVK